MSLYATRMSTTQGAQGTRMIPTPAHQALVINLRNSLGNTQSQPQKQATVLTLSLGKCRCVYLSAILKCHVATTHLIKARLVQCKSALWV